MNSNKMTVWGMLLKSAGMVYLFAVLVMIALAWYQLRTVNEAAGKHVAVVNLEGEISASADANAASLIDNLDKAFADKDSVGVILRVNSPGGTVVQSGMVNDEIYRLKALYPAKKIVSVVEDVDASGAYYISSATDDIYVDKGSIVGSIGVKLEGFDYTGAMKMLGVKRRTLTAGEHKEIVDSFAPMKHDEKRYLMGMLTKTHDQFIKVIHKGRGDRLKDFPGLFSGLIWNGDDAIKLGLADGYGTIGTVSRDLFKVEKTVVYGTHEGFVDHIMHKFGLSVADGLRSMADANGMVLK